MAKITVKVRSDRGDLGTHPRFGKLVPGAKLTIEEEDFGAGIFERPSAGWLSPHEKADAARAAEIKSRVGAQEPPAPAPTETRKKAKEVDDHA